VDTDHFLIALARYEDEISANAMLAFGLNLETLRSTAIEITPAQISRCGRELTITTQARDAQAGAWEEALQLQHVMVGPEHLLLAILHQQVGSASRILDASDVDRRGLRSQIFKLMRAGND
jgi:ATP-dependent Clp protease ATP-binding subunit ClpC